MEQKEKQFILVIDDEQSIRENINDYLTEFGFRVETAEDGAIGIQKAIQYKPDLIICDIAMPNMDGFEVYNTLQNVPSTSLTPFIFLTAKTQPSEIRAGMQLGADDYITKPFKFSDLVASINKRIEKIEHYKMQNKSQLTALTESPLNAIYIYQGNTFIYTNAAFLESLGYTCESFIKKTFSQIISGENKDKDIDKIHQCMNGSKQTVLLKTWFKNSENKDISTTLYGKHIELTGKHTLVGNVVFSEPDNPSYSNQLNPIELENLTELLLKERKDLLAEDMIKLTKSITALKKPRKTPGDGVHLTVREKEILQLVCQGYTNSEIAEKLYLSNRTVDNHRANILSKTGSKNTAYLVAFSVKYLDVDI
jgi:PAS domain S-box-containing protein